MDQTILVIHVIVAVALVGLILMQHSKGSDAGAAFGGGSSQSLLGSAGSTPLFTKITVGLVTLFFATSITLAYLNRHAIGEEAIIIEAPGAKIEAEVSKPANDSDIPQVTVNPVNDDVPSGDAPSGDVPNVSDQTDIPQ